MAIAFEPAEVKALTAAFDRICRELKLERKAEPVRGLVARKVIEFADHGSRSNELLGLINPDSPARFTGEPTQHCF